MRAWPRVRSHVVAVGAVVRCDVMWCVVQCVHVFVQLRPCAIACLCMSLYLDVCAYMCMYMCMSVCIYIYIYIFIYLCIHICVCVRVCALMLKCAARLVCNLCGPYARLM